LTKLWCVIRRWSWNLLKKSDIRTALLAKRYQIDPIARELAATAAAKIFLGSHLFKANLQFACYLSQADEFDCTPIIRAVWAAQKNCYLPVLPELQKKQLEFALYRPGDHLRLNRYHIFEPEALSFFPAEKLDIALVPLLGFDSEGNRLGRGGGYYDATFSFLLKSEIRRPFLLGLGYEGQKMLELPNDSWDVKLDGVLTEQGLIICNRAPK